jgi:hypothetical protein
MSSVVIGIEDKVSKKKQVRIAETGATRPYLVVEQQPVGRRQEGFAASNAVHEDRYEGAMAHRQPARDRCTHGSIPGT